MSVTYRRVGFIISGLLHLAVATAFVTQIDTAFKKNDVDRPLPLTLAMFEEAETATPIPEPAPVTPAKTESEKRIPEEKTHQPVLKPKPVIPVEPVIKTVVNPEPDTKNNSEIVTRLEPVIEPEAQQETVQAPRLSSRQESLKQRYIRMLLKRIHKKKHYPRQARHNREEGEVLVSFVIGQSGDISFIEVSRSSGHATLDKAAIKTLARVSPLQPLPDELGLTHWKLTVPIAFNLRK